MSEITNIDELHEYSSAQFQVIVNLQKKVKELEDQNRSLQGMLEGSIGNIQLAITDIIPGISSEQLICETQIGILKQRAVQTELTIEEIKKFQILSDVLERIRKTAKPEDKAKEMPDAQILSIIDGNQ